MSKKIIFAACAMLIFLFPGISGARENVTDWYIKDFDSQIVVNKDSSLDITETITADCGQALGKHGIFRILPTQTNIAGKKVPLPIELQSITNQNGQAHKFQETKNRKDGTVTWKIGDANVTVQGVNVYVIRYKVKNAVRFGNEGFDELYWNLSGNFWDLPIDKFHAKLVFPSEVNNQNATVEYYTGASGSKTKDLATFHWSAPNVLEFDSTKTLQPRQAITASVIFPKNIFTPYQMTLQEKYTSYVALLIPLFVLLFCYVLWRKFGDDPEFEKTIIPEYEIPQDLSPIEVGMLMKSGKMQSQFITAEIIFFATKGLISIKEIEDKILFFTSKDYEITKIDKPELEEKLNAPQKQLLKRLFGGNNAVLLSSLKKKFYKDVPEIKKAAEETLRIKGLIVPTGLHLGIFLQVLSGFGAWLTFVAFGESIILSISVLLAALIAFIFSFIMPKRTLKGAELNWKISGFKLFMETVDKDRAAFYERENIFEKCLPYAIIFGMVKEWTNKMQEMYGTEYFINHAPLWYVGNVTAFDADNFSSTLDSLSSQIAASTSAPSGSGGMGGSGGGGGGGGGGGW